MSARPSQARIDAAAERLYALLPAHIRSMDAANGRALRALVGVLASGSAEIDREIDTLYDSMFVETAPEGALADLAALVAAETLRPLLPGSGLSARAFIANTVRYRRGKGTARVLEALAADVGGFGAVAVEYFQRLSRCQHLLDVRPERPGTARLVAGATAARVGTGFDMLPRLVDVRSIARAGGRHHVPHVGVHILRPVVPFFRPPRTDAILDATAMAGVPLARPWPGGANQRAGYFQLSAQPGRPLRLFNPDRRAGHESERVAESRLPDRLRRLPLHLETEELRAASVEGREAALGDAPWFAESQPFTIFLRLAGAALFTRVPPAEVQIANLDVLPTTAQLRPAATQPHQWYTGGRPSATLNAGNHPVSCGFDPVTGRLIVAAVAAAAPDVAEVRIAHGTGIGREMGAGPHDRNTADVPFDITDTDRVTHFVRIVDAASAATGVAADNVRRVQTLATALAEWASGGAGKRGLVVLVRCDREGAVGRASNIPVEVHPGSELHIVSAQWRPVIARPGVAGNAQRRGYVVRRERRFTVDAALRVTASAPPPAGARPGVLVLDGLELTAGISLGARAVSRMLVRHCTLRNPGDVALGTTARMQGAEIALERTIAGRIRLDLAGDAGTGSLVVTDSIVSADDAAGAAISVASLDARLVNVTVLGTSEFKSLEATNVIFSGAITATRRQSGCVRYSSIAAGSLVPRRFRCQPDLALAAATRKKGSTLTAPETRTAELGVTPIFLDASLDEPTVAMLHPATSDAIRLGGENDTAMGVFSAAAEGLRTANLTSLFDDYVPFGLEAGVIDDTRSSRAATQGNRP